MACTPRSESGISSDAYLRKMLRRRWRAAFIAGGSKTCNVYRYQVTSAGTPPAGLPPGYALDAGLTALETVVSQTGRYEGEGSARRFVPFREGTLEFGFVDFPTAGGVAAGTILLSDFVEYDGRFWQVVAIRNDIAVLSYATAELYGR